MSMTTATSLRLTAVLVIAAVAVLPRPARAQSPAAEQLFREGKRLMAKGDTAPACEKFEASERIEPAAGTELNLALCRETNGQIASAWATYIKTATTAKKTGDARREATARKKVAELEPRLIYLTITVPASARGTGLVVKRDDTVVEPAEWDQRTPVDPAEYTVSAEAPGYKPWSTSVVVKTRSKTVDVPELEKLPEVQREPPRAAGGAAAAGARERDAEDTKAHPAPSRWTGKRKLSLALVAVGVAAGGAGIALGLHANSLEDQSDQLCNHPTCHSPDAVDLNHSARRYALAANIGYAVGGAAVVGAAVLWLFGAPHSPERSRPDDTAMIPILDAGRVGFAFARSF